jgi:hypothetical protein
MTDRRRLNRLITSSGLDEISCANMKFADSLCIHHIRQVTTTPADKISLARSAAPPEQDGVRCAVVGELAS